MTAATVLETIRRLLNENGVEFRQLEHEPTFTSADSARVRGESLSIGAKALLIKTDDSFRLFVLPADRKLDSQALRRALNVKKSRFATADELLELTGLVPGSVPPFGRPVLALDLFADPALRENEKVAFNAGSLSTSIVMRSADYARVARPEWLAFSQSG